MSNESERAAFEAWIEETSGFSSDDESIAWSSWKARASLFNAASAEGAIYQILTEEGAWLDTTREYYERVKSDPALARVVYAAPQPPAQADAREALDEIRATVCAIAVVGSVDGHDVIRRASAIDLIDRRRARLQGAKQ